MLVRYVKIISLTLIFFLIIFSPALFLNTSGENLLKPDAVDVAAPNVVIALHDRNKTAHVAPWDLKIVKLNGTVSVTSPPGARLEVDLSAAGENCFAKVIPRDFIFQRSGEESFVVYAYFNEGESCNTIGLVTVSGYWSSMGTGAQGQASPEEGVTARIDVAPYYYTVYNCPKSYEEASPGARLEFELRVLNIGNDYNTYTVELLNEQKLHEKGFEVTLSSSRIEVPSRQTGIIYIFVNTPHGTKGMGVNEIYFRVHQEKGEDVHISPRELSVDVAIPYEHIVYTTEFYLVLAIIILIIIISIILIRWRMKKKNRLNLFNNEGE